MENVDLKLTIFLGMLTASVLIGMFIALAILLSKKQQTHQQEKIELLKKYHHLVESMNDSVFVINKAMSVVLWNQNFLDNFSIFLKNDQVYPINKIFNHQIVTEIEKEIFGTFHNRKFHRKELRYSKNNSTYWFEMSFDPQYDESRKVESILCISRDITERREMENKQAELVGILKEQQKSLQMLSREVIRAQEEERARISREIHDGIGQALTAITFNLETLNDANMDTKLLTKRIKDCKILVNNTLKDVHRFASQLRPAILDELGLIPALSDYAKAYMERKKLDITIDSRGKIEEIDDELKTVLYRIFQESLTNIVKHAQANKVKVNIDYSSDQLSYSIEDDGKGFFPDEVLVNNGDHNGLGLKGIRERMELIGGTFELMSKPNQGTRLRVSIPFGKA